MSGAFGKDNQLERRVAHLHDIERALLMIGLKQAIEAEQRREEHRNPQYRRADAGEKVEIGPDREGEDCGKDEKEYDPNRVSAAAAPRDCEFAPKQRGKRGPHQASAAERGGAHSASRAS